MVGRLQYLLEEKNLLKEIELNNKNIFSFPLDVTNKQKCMSVFLDIKNKLGNIDICVFSTGTWNPKKEKEIDVEQIEDVMKVNFSVHSIALNQLKNILKKKNGHISIVSSIAGYRGLPNSTGYGPSKSALNNLAESLYFDFKRYKVRVSLISPGFIKTPMTDKNDFKMPFLKTVDYAADKIYEGLINSKNFEIDFPKQLTLILKIFKIMPNKIYLGLVEKLTKFQKK